MHCSLKGQDKVAQIFQEELGNLIFDLPSDFENYNYLPSPSQLKKKILIKGKRHIKNMISEDNQDSDIEEQSKGELSPENSRKEAVLQNSNSKNAKEVMSYQEQKYKSSPKLEIQTDFAKKEFDSPQKLNNIISQTAQENQLNISQLSNYVYSSQNLKTDERLQTFGVKSPMQLNKNIKTEDFVFNLAEDDINGGGVHTRRINNAEDMKDPTNIFGSDERPNCVVPNNINIISVGSKNLDQNQSAKKTKECATLTILYSLISYKWSFNTPRLSWHISSITENKFAKFSKSNLKELIDNQRKNMTKIYPSGKRIDSSNFNPIPSWNIGAQIVALNAQIIDEATCLNYAKFIANGACGYILKPNFLRHIAIDSKDPNMNKYLSSFTKPLKKITIKVISGKQIRQIDDLAIVSPAVEIKLRGIDIDESTNPIFKTPFIRDNGFNPFWSKDRECKVEFRIHCPDLCILLFNVNNEDSLGSYRIAWYAIELNHIVQGYRAIPLIDNSFEIIQNAYILCHINIEDF